MFDSSLIELRKFVAPEFIFGNGALKLVGQCAKNFGASKVLIVTDQGIIREEWTGKVIKCLDEEGLPYALFSDVTPNPRAEEVMTGAKYYQNEGCNVIVAVGGGSVIDCAKGIGIVSKNHQNILDFAGVDLIQVPGPPLICVPTTGVGVDISQFAVITDIEKEMKMCLCSKTLVPDVSLIDPDTTLTLPVDQTAYTGIDAFTHALEAYVSNASSPLTDLLALDAMKLLYSYLISTIREPKNPEHRLKIALGSLEAGLAFSNASLGLAHALSHSLGGKTDLPHGECNAVFIPYVVRFNYDAVSERYNQIGEAVGLDLEGLSQYRKKTMVIDKISGFQQEIEALCKLEKIRISKEDIPVLARKAMKSLFIVTNPRPVGVEDAAEIFRKAI
ncbi:MAG TPA: iron-containing alcohol dehydrogenase [Methanocella sp.]|nr:iron-containing alcohol dehydrogenase [Methanocella sp.]